MNLVKEFLLLKAKVDKLYCQLIAKSPDEQDPTVPNHVKTIKQEDIDNWNNVKEEEVQITEDTAFAQIEQTQKDFNKSVSDYKIDSDLKNQEQDNRLSNIESKNIAQNDLINDLQADLDNQVVINENQDERIVNLEGINYTWSPTNRTLTLYDNNGNQLSQVSLVSLDNEGTDIRYNASTLSLELYNTDNELLDSIPVSSFIGSVGTQLQLNSNQLQLKDSQGNILSTVGFTVSNIQGLQSALDGKLEKGTYTGTAQDLKNSIDGKLNKPTTTGNTTSHPFVVGEDGNGNSARLPAGDLGKNFFNADLSNTTARTHTMNAGVTVNTLGNPHTLSGLPNKNADITNFRKVRVQNTSGLDAVVDSKSMLLDMPSYLTEQERTNWKTAMNGGWTTNTMSVYMIVPFVISQGQDVTTVLTLFGANLNLPPTSFKIEICTADSTPTNTTVIATIDNSAVNLQNSSELNFYYNFKNLATGNYKIRLWNGVAYYLTDQTFSIISNSNITNINVGQITWEQLFDDKINAPQKSFASGNTVHTELETYSSPPIGGLTPVFSFKSSPIATYAENLYLEFDISGAVSGGNTLPIYGMHIGLGASELANQLTNISDFYAAVGRNSHDRYDGALNGIPVTLGNWSNSTQSKLVIVKQANKVSLFMYNQQFRGFISVTLNNNNNNNNNMSLYATGYYKTFNDNQTYTLLRAYKF